jgi:uncharacterized protein YdaU (DUF1376 family)
MKETKPKGRAPAFQFYADDFLAGTMTMTNEERGAYISLLCLQWSKGFVTELDIQRMCHGMPTHCQGICQSKFQIGEDGHYRNNRLEKERTKQKERSEKQRDIANLRWNKDANALPEHMPDDAKAYAESVPEVCFPSPSPSPKKKKETALSEWELLSGVEAPECFRTKNCMDAIRLWMQHKTEKGDSYKKTGLKMVLAKWANQFTTAEFPSMVEHAIASNWKGVFRPDRHTPVSTSAKPGPNPNDPTDIRNYL